MIDFDIFGSLPVSISENIKVLAVRHHSKASEAYVDVEFQLSDGSKWTGSVPVNYRRTGLDAQTKDDCEKILEEVRQCLSTEKVEEWKSLTIAFWDAGKKKVTRPFFDAMFDHLGEWTCQGCQLPENPNWARRFQDIKEFGFTVATNTSLRCENCGSNKTHVMLLPVPQGGITGYEVISIELKKKIIKILSSYDAYEGKAVSSASLLPDHKFPEIRWNEATRSENPETMPEDEIRAKFQLITNQRNEQKREVCRACYQTGERGFPFGIEFFYTGDNKWPEGIPKNGSEAEQGCKGCGWYDLSAWRKALGELISNSS